MTDYISPMFGDILEEVYSRVVVFKKSGYSSYADLIKRDFGYGKLRSGILWLETEFNEPMRFTGEKLYSYLLSKGFSSSVSSNLVRTFAANQTLVDDLIEQGFSVDDAVYGVDLRSRLNALNLISRSITASYAFGSEFIIYPIIEIPEEIVVPPPPEIIYRSQATFTYSSRKQGTRVELRIWYQSYEPIEEEDLIDKWNEANENAVNLTNEQLLDSMEASPGFEHNHEISRGEIEGSIGTWYGKLIMSRQSKYYEYDVL